MNALLAELTKLIPLVGLVSLRVAVVFALLPAPFGDLAPARTRAVLCGGRGPQFQRFAICDFGRITIRSTGRV